jgi:hypothetical protein
LQDSHAGKQSRGVRESRHQVPPEYDIKVQSPLFAVGRGYLDFDISVRGDGSTEKRPRRPPAHRAGLSGADFGVDCPARWIIPEQARRLVEKP